MTTQFKDRTEAGRNLATELKSYADRADVLVLALPRGGVPVAAEIAKRLHAPLDVFVVRKLGLPGYPELAMGAIASGGVQVLNGDVINSFRIRDYIIDGVATQERRELERRERAYRDDMPPPELAGKTVIVVDDGIATGSTMLAAIAALRQLDARKIVVAAPVIARATFYEIHKAADSVVALLAPERFYGVGQWYEDFTQTTDNQVRKFLAELNHPAALAAA